MKRLDTFLVEQGLVASRTRAQNLIRAGHVQVRAATITKPAHAVPDKCGAGDIKLRSDSEITRYVSRGGLKLEHALKHCNLDARNLSVLDVGISTGGFSQCLLQSGAARVTGVDVGHGQLHPILAGRVRLLEGINARTLSRAAELKGEQFDLIVADVSFISLGLILPELVPYLKGDGRVLALVKPQFEAGAAFLNKKGIVKDQKAFAKVRARVEDWCKRLQLTRLDYFEAAVEGSDGNQEFFLYAKMGGHPGPGPDPGARSMHHASDPN